MAAGAARREPDGGVRGIGTDRATWRTARAWAQGQGTTVTADLLATAVLHGLLAEPVPVAVLARWHGLTRRDLDQAVTHLPGLPEIPAPGHVAALRGT